VEQEWDKLRTEREKLEEEKKAIEQARRLLEEERKKFDLERKEFLELKQKNTYAIAATLRSYACPQLFERERASNHSSSKERRSLCRD
jgi:hypothetical protein